MGTVLGWDRFTHLMDKRIRIGVLLLTASTAVTVAGFILAFVFDKQDSAANSAESRTRNGGYRLPAKAPLSFLTKSSELSGAKMPNSVLDPAGPFPASQQGRIDALKARLDVPNAVPHEAVLSFKDKVSLQKFVSQLRAHGLELLGTLDKLNTIRIRYSDVAALANLLAEAGDTASAEANLWLRVPQEPSVDPNNEGGTTPVGKAQQMMAAISAGGDRSQWGESITVAVLDTGVLDHPTFADSQVTHIDLVHDGQTFHSHGTSVASLIAGQDPQAPGVAPAANILDVRVANAEGYTVSTVLAEGIIEAVDRGAKVLNVSLGGYGDSQVLRSALDYAWQKGAVVVAASGNDGYSQLSIPAAYEGVLSVGSVDGNGKQASFSNSGQGLDLVAPGVGDVTAWETDKVAIASGTSHSAGLVSGAAAAYLAWGVTAAEVANLLKRHATPTGAPTTLVGSGILTIKANAGR